MPTSSQGSTVSWGGTNIGSLTSIRIQSSQAQFEDVTGTDAVVNGEGDNSRVVTQQDCVAVEAASVDVGLFGVPPYALSDIGKRDTVSVVLDGGELSAEAFLESFDVTASVGEFLVGTARFRLSGN